MAVTYRTAQIAAKASAPKAQPACSVPERAAMTSAQCHKSALLYTDDKPFSIFKS